MTTEQTALQRLKEVCEKATSGPWELDKPGKAPHTIVSRSGNWETLVMNISFLADAEKNGPFLLAARTALPALIEYCEKLEQLAALVEPAQEIGWLEEQGWREEHVLRVASFKIQHATAAVKAARAKLEDSCPK